MSLRLEMLQVARLAPKVLGESADLVREFLQRQQNPDGGFKDRAGFSDLYYTVFGVDALLALRAEIALEPLLNFLRTFGDGGELDFVHLCCLARCWAGAANVSEELCSSEITEHGSRILARIETYRAADGGYNPARGKEFSTAYGAFLAFGAYQDFGVPIPDPLRLVQSLKFLETPDGAWANERQVKVGSTNATAAAVSVLRNLGMPVSDSVGDWLLARAHSQGGFVAAPNVPIPDLLSTATALHALAGIERGIGELKDGCLDFVDSLWTNEGAFHGTWNDEALDCEYTFYGLLALGHLSL